MPKKIQVANTKSTDEFSNGILRRSNKISFIMMIL
jgi:hypothetical protein